MSFKQAKKVNSLIEKLEGLCSPSPPREEINQVPIELFEIKTVLVLILLLLVVDGKLGLRNNWSIGRRDIARTEDLTWQHA